MTFDGLTRRDFLKKSARGAAAFTAGFASFETLLGCAGNIFSVKTGPVVYPELRAHRVQPPEHGCRVGFYQEYADLLPGYKRNKDTGRVVDYYQEKLGKKPALCVIQEGHRYLTSITAEFPREEAEQIASRGVIPQIYPATGFKRLEDIANGMYDRGVHTFAEGARQFGEQYGGFFVLPMWEMNIPDTRVSKWVYQPGPFKKAWRKLHSILGEEGANEYATWALEYHVDFDLPGYYPGDDIVDWIGLSAYNRKVNQIRYGYRSLGGLVESACDYFGDKHPDKPLMIAEVGSTVGRDQPDWIRKAFEYLKLNQGIKGITYWDSIWRSRTNGKLDNDKVDNHSLQPDSLLALQEILKDPYFITAE